MTSDNLTPEQCYIRDQIQGAIANCTGKPLGDETKEQMIRVCELIVERHTPAFKEIYDVKYEIDVDKKTALMTITPKKMISITVVLE